MRERLHREARLQLLETCDELHSRIAGRALARSRLAHEEVDALKSEVSRYEVKDRLRAALTEYVC